MGGLLVTLAPNVVNKSTNYTNYARNPIQELLDTTDQVTPANSPHVAEMCLKKGRAPGSLRAYTNASQQSLSHWGVALSHTMECELSLQFLGQ